MTDQELQQLAMVYAAKLSEDANLPNCLKNETLEMNQAYLLDFLRWLTETYCIVCRAKVTEEYKDNQKALKVNEGDNGYFEGYWEGRVSALEDLFSESTFENPKTT